MPVQRLTDLTIDLFHDRSLPIFAENVAVDLGGRSPEQVPYPELAELATKAALAKDWVSGFVSFGKSDLQRISVGDGPEIDVSHIVSGLVAQPT